MQRPTFTATGVIDARRVPEKGAMEFNLVDAKGNTQNLVLDNVAVSHVLAAILQKSHGSGPLPEVHLNESIPLHSLGTFRLPEHAGLRMYISPQSVIDFVFAPEYVATLKNVVDRFAAAPAPAQPTA